MADKDQIARLVIHDIETIPDREYSRLVRWLRDKADEFAKCDRSQYAKRYTARLWKEGK